MPLECGIIFDGIPEGAIPRKVGLIWGIPADYFSARKPAAIFAVSRLHPSRVPIDGVRVPFDGSEIVFKPRRARPESTTGSSLGSVVPRYCKSRTPCG